jgi:formylglycine-generating enzyme required for sulfatase activity
LLYNHFSHLLVEIAMGHIFISYSHKDTEYAHRLADTLQSEGFNVWIDARLDYGSQWPSEIQKQLDSCDAFILIMTPRAFASDWVQSELQRAKRKLKPIFPLLLEGDEPWLSVESTQYYDVRGQMLPDAKFYSTLEHVTSRTQGPGLQLPAGDVKISKPQGVVTSFGFNAKLILAIVGVFVVLLAVGIPIFWSSLSQNNAVPTEFVQATSPSPLEQTSNPQASSTETSAAPTEPPAVPVSSDLSDSAGVPMRLVPAGKFTMGSRNVDAAVAQCQQDDSSCDQGWFEDELVPHVVALDAFYMDIYEVTNGRYADCVNAGVCQPPLQTSSDSRSSYYGNSDFDNYPVIFVNWVMAKTYCEWRGARLPTEAEWEKAARGTDERTYPWGENIDDSYANYNNSNGDTTEVGGYESGKTPYGLYDMAGNVWEWVADYYSASYYSDSPSSNPLGPHSGSGHVLRGGSWFDHAYFIRTTTRKGEEADVPRDNNFGFRCAKDANP